MFSKELVESVVQELEKYAQDAQITDLENLAKIAVYQDSVKRKRASENKKTTGQQPDLYESLAASVALAK